MPSFRSAGTHNVTKETLFKSITAVTCVFWIAAWLVYKKTGNDVDLHAFQIHL